VLATDIDVHAALSSQVGVQARNDRTPGGLDVLELEECTGLGADDLDFLDGAEA